MVGAQWFGAASFGLALLMGALLLKEVESNASELPHAKSSKHASRATSADSEPAPVAWIIRSQGASFKNSADVSGSELNGTLPVVLKANQELTLAPEGQLKALVFSQGVIRQFEGPAKLKVIQDTISVVDGPAVKVFPVNQKYLLLADQWMKAHQSDFTSLNAKTIPVSSDQKQVSIIYPVDGALMLTRRPEFQFAGPLPKDSTLIIYRQDSRRHWVQQLDNLHVTFPPAAEFQWGESFTWEVRKRTGGRLLEGKFRIASQQQATELLQSKVPALPDTPTEDLLFYALQLQLAGAYKEASNVVESMKKY